MTTLLVLNKLVSDDYNNEATSTELVHDDVNPELSSSELVHDEVSLEHTSFELVQMTSALSSLVRTCGW